MKITGIDITDEFIKRIDSVEWVNYGIDGSEKFSSTNDNSVVILINGQEYEFILKYEIKRIPIDIIFADHMNDDYVEYIVKKEGEFDFDIFLSGKEILKHDFINIEFDEYEIMDKIERT